MKKTIAALVFCGAALGAGAGMAQTPAPAMAAKAVPDYVVIKLTQDVARTPEQTWAKVGGYCTISVWLKVDCAISGGDGTGVGTIRALRGGTVQEIMVAQTPYSYTYTQPASTILYHGTLAAEPIDGGQHTRLHYTLFYDAGPLATVEAKVADRNSRAKRFGDALLAMKAMAEAQ